MTAVVTNEVARGERVLLREKRLADAANDYRWRTDPELTRYDAARPLTMTYREYVALYREELLYGSPYRRSFAVETGGGEHIGNVMHYNIDLLRAEAELGITIGEQSYWGRGYGAEAMRLAAEHLLGRAGFRRLHLKTLDWNERARRAFERAGFVQFGQAQRGGHTFVLMELRREWLTPAATSPA